MRPFLHRQASMRGLLMGGGSMTARGNVSSMGALRNFLAGDLNVPADNLNIDDVINMLPGNSNWDKSPAPTQGGGFPMPPVGALPQATATSWGSMPTRNQPMAQAAMGQMSPSAQRRPLNIQMPQRGVHNSPLSPGYTPPPGQRSPGFASQRSPGFISQLSPGSTPGGTRQRSPAAHQRGQSSHPNNFPNNPQPPSATGKPGRIYFFTFFKKCLFEFSIISLLWDGWQRCLISFLVKKKWPVNLHNPYSGCWWPAMQGISKALVLVLPEL